MRRLGVIALVVLAAPGSALAASAHVPTFPQAEIPAGRSLAALAQHRHSLLALESSFGAEALVRAEGGALISPQLRLWRVTGAAAPRLVLRLADLGLLRYAEPDRLLSVHGHLSAGDPLAPPQHAWHLYRVGADRAEPPGPGVPVTLVDSGLDTNHMEFRSRPNTVLLNAQSVPSLDPDEYHGTMVASTAAAPSEGLGTVGIYPQAVLRSYDLEFLSESWIIAAITRSMAAGPSVINLSLGSPDPSRALYETTMAAFGAGSIVVAASGNERLRGDPEIFPASFPHVLTVGATDMSDNPSIFSSSSDAVDLVAPGEFIPWQHPTDPTFHSTVSGTSFAAPIVSAATAWTWTVRRNLEKTQVLDVMRLSARNLGPAGFDRRTGLGLLDIPTALARRPPQVDPQEPNDDIDHVKARGIFRAAARPLTAPGIPRSSRFARLHAVEDPDDVYRVWVPARRTIVATVKPTANVELALWGARTRSVFERGSVRQRDLLDFSSRPGKKPDSVNVTNATARGFFAYVDVFPGRGVRSAGYRLAIRTARP